MLEKGVIILPVKMAAKEVDPNEAPNPGSPIPARKPGNPAFKDHYPEAKIPDGFQPPPHIKSGAEFTATATCKIKDGKLCLLALDGCPLEDDEEPEIIKNDVGIRETLRQLLPATGLPD
jgi:hypothetical protein